MKTVRGVDAERMQQQVARRPVIARPEANSSRWHAFAGERKLSGRIRGDLVQRFAFAVEGVFESIMEER